VGVEGIVLVLYKTHDVYCNWCVAHWKLLLKERRFLGAPASLCESVCVYVHVLLSCVSILLLKHWWKVQKVCWTLIFSFSGCFPRWENSVAS